MHSDKPKDYFVVIKLLRLHHQNAPYPFSDLLGFCPVFESFDAASEFIKASLPAEKQEDHYRYAIMHIQDYTYDDPDYAPVIPIEDVQATFKSPLDLQEFNPEGLNPASVGWTPSPLPPSLEHDLDRKFHDLGMCNPKLCLICREQAD